MDFSNRQYLQTESENSTKIREFNENEIIFQKGEDGDCMYEVLSGSVGIYIHYGEPNETLLVEKTAGSFFGEIALVENRPRTATAVALDDKTRLAEISTLGFIYYIRKNPDNLKVIMDAMSDRFKEQRQEYFDVCDCLAEYFEAMENYEMVSGELSIKIQNYILESKKHKQKLLEQEKKK